ncbi:MAG TPA: adenylyl-sulfate kinase [Bacteroidales bacterium]|nr:adenylyl-sulfate kinase [Bacteroidales bacterium]
MQTGTLQHDTLYDWPRLRLLKESRLRQHARVLWMCGLSGAGKTTLAAELDKRLLECGFLSQVIDGDVVRGGVNKGLGFSEADRRENLRRVAELARLFTGCGIITIVAFISPTEEARHTARNIIGETDFTEVFVNAPFEVCEQRDTKGLYKQAREGKISDFTGIDSPFEVPGHPDIEIKTNLLSVEEGTQKLLDYILPFVEFKEYV